MCCSTHESHQSSHCSCGCHSEKLWSSKKKIEVLNHRLECLKNEEKDILDALEELRK